MWDDEFDDECARCGRAYKDHLIIDARQVTGSYYRRENEFLRDVRVCPTVVFERKREGGQHERAR